MFYCNYCENSKLAWYPDSSTGEMNQWHCTQCNRLFILKDNVFISRLAPRAIVPVVHTKSLDPNSVEFHLVIYYHQMRIEYLYACRRCSAIFQTSANALVHINRFINRSACHAIGDGLQVLPPGFQEIPEERLFRCRYCCYPLVDGNALSEHEKLCSKSY
jgi:hypothetical protein